MYYFQLFRSVSSFPSPQPIILEKAMESQSKIKLCFGQSPPSFFLNIPRWSDGLLKALFRVCILLGCNLSSFPYSPLTTPSVLSVNKCRKCAPKYKQSNDMCWMTLKIKMNLFLESEKKNWFGLCNASLIEFSQVWAQFEPDFNSKNTHSIVSGKIQTIN